MIKNLLPSIKKSFDERMANPILGSFSLAWCVSNWKIFLILVFSEKAIEEKISLVESSYMGWDTLIVFPLMFTAFYLLISPWLLLGVQVLQDKANSQRKLQKIESDTKYITNKVELVKAESSLEEVRLHHELTIEIERKRRELELDREKAKHDFEIERERKHLEFEFEDRKSEYEERRRSKESELEHEKRMRELEFEEKKRQEELQLEKFKAETERNRSRSTA